MAKTKGRALGGEQNPFPLQIKASSSSLLQAIVPLQLVVCWRRRALLLTPKPFHARLPWGGESSTPFSQPRCAPTPRLLSPPRMPAGA